MQVCSMKPTIIRRHINDRHIFEPRPGAINRPHRVMERYGHGLGVAQTYGKAWRGVHLADLRAFRVISHEELEYRLPIGFPTPVGPAPPSSARKVFSHAVLRSCRVSGAAPCKSFTFLILADTLWR